MAPTYLDIRDLSGLQLYRRQNDSNTFGSWRDMTNAEAYIVEGWGEGFMLGALFIMAVITIANMRRGVLLHKMILLELLLAMSHGTFCFMAFSGYGWYLSATAALLYSSYFTHNVVAWMKIRPFFTGPQPSFSPRFCKWVTRIYLITLAMTAPVIIFEIFNNFRFFNNYSRLYEAVRPYEPLMRDPWWVFSCATFFHEVRRSYSMDAFKLIRSSPRFGILLAAMCIALLFTIVDILASIIPALSITDGINPYWKLALVFKCLTDNIMLDDFKSVLERLRAVSVDESTANATQLDGPIAESEIRPTSRRRRSLRRPGSRTQEAVDGYARGRKLSREDSETTSVTTATTKINRGGSIELGRNKMRCQSLGADYLVDRTTLDEHERAIEFKASKEH